MRERTITLSLRLTDQEKKETYAVVERPIFVSSEEGSEGSIRTISDLIEDIIDAVNQACEKQSLTLLDKEALAQELPILLLVSLLKEDISELSHDVVVTSSEDEKPEGEGNGGD